MVTFIVVFILTNKLLFSKTYMVSFMIMSILPYLFIYFYSKTNKNTFMVRYILIFLFIYSYFFKNLHGCFYDHVHGRVHGCGQHDPQTSIDPEY